MEHNPQQILDLIAYLKQAKVEQWAIDIGDLMERFNLDKATVDRHVNKIMFS